MARIAATNIYMEPELRKGYVSPFEIVHKMNDCKNNAAGIRELGAMRGDAVIKGNRILARANHHPR
jgi:hypothetical protein